MIFRYYICTIRHVLHFPSYASVSVSIFIFISISISISISVSVLVLGLKVNNNKSILEVLKTRFWGLVNN